MKKILIILSVLLTGFYLVNAINLNLSSGDKLDISSWQNINNITSKINLDNNNLNINGKLIVSSKICFGNTCLENKEGTESNPGTSCKAILDSGDSIGDGIYYIDPDGGDDSNKFQVYCDMTTDGGGWTRYDYNYYSGPCAGMACGSTSTHDLPVGIPEFTHIKGLKQTQSGNSCGYDNAKVYLNGNLCSCEGDYCYNHSYRDAIFDCSGNVNVGGTNTVKQYGYLSCSSAAPQIWVGTEGGYIYLR